MIWELVVGDKIAHVKSRDMSALPYLVHILSLGITRMKSCHCPDDNMGYIFLKVCFQT